MMNRFSFLDRPHVIQQLGVERFDLVVIGGGINGAGVARDASLRGLKVALIEAQDFAAGTSSRSSKLIHGGIRYLENLEFRLVFEALSERQKLFDLAPNLVHPLRFMIPLYKSGRVGMFQMGLGMWLYDILSLFQAPELHERLNFQETIKRMPLLQRGELLGSYVYSDAYMDDDRLVHETLRSAVRAGAKCVSFVKATGFHYSNQGGCVVKCRDLISGKDFSIQGQQTVSSVGPWTDELGKTISPKWKNILRPTKGVHLTFTRETLPLSSAVVMGTEQRIVFGIPRHEMVIVGTTDTDFSGDPAKVQADAEDIRYLLDVTAKYFPGAKLRAENIVGSYAGVRPLVRDESDSEGKTSREHTIFQTDNGVTYVAGGKYTTYRLMAEQVVDRVAQRMPIERRVSLQRCSTERQLNPLVSTESQDQKNLFVSEILDKTKWTETSASNFFDRHGAESLEIIRRLGPGYSAEQAEAFQALENTSCSRLVDFYARRVPFILSLPDHGMSHLAKMTHFFAEYLGWDKQRIDVEQKVLKNYLASELHWRDALGRSNSGV